MQHLGVRVGREVKAQLEVRAEANGQPASTQARHDIDIQNRVTATLYDADGGIVAQLFTEVDAEAITLNGHTYQPEAPGRYRG